MSYMSKGVILEIGQFYTKVGFAHENTPLKLLRTMDYFIYENVKIGESYEKFGERALSHKNKEAKMFKLHEFFDDIFYNVLALEPEDKKVYICLNLLVSRVFIDMIMEILFDKFSVESVVFLPNNFLPLYMTGCFTGLVVDSGLLDTQVLPIYDGSMLKKAFDYTPLGTIEVMRKISSLYKEKEKKERSETIMNKIDDFEFLNTLTLKFCQVMPLEVAHDLDKPEVMEKLRKKEINVLEGRLIDLGLFAKAIEGYFQQDDFSDIVETILNAIKKCPKKLRESIAGNIILSGGGFLLKGMKARLRQELIYRVSHDPKYSNIKTLIKEKAKFSNITYPCNLISWSGAKIFSQMYNQNSKVKTITKALFTNDIDKCWEIIDSFFFI